MRFFLIFFLISNFSFAAEIPVPVQKNLSAHNLLGKSEVKFIGLKRYEIALWSESKSFSYDNRFALHFKYNMNFTKKILAEEMVDDIEDLHEIKWSERSQYRSKLDSILVNIKKGDEITALFDPKNGVILFYKNQKIGEISSLKFARYFVDIWLDEKGSYPKVATQILGKKHEKNS